METRYKAAAALGISVVGFAASYPYAGTGFGGGLINSGFLAATIGGLADWFAVTAIFRKPLGIPWHTQILTRNRERIMNSIVDFASEDLLSTEHIMEIVQKQSMAHMLVDYFELRGGRERLKGVLDQFLLKATREMDMQVVAAHFAPALRELLKGVPMERLVQGFLASIAKEKYSVRVLDTLLDIGQRILASPEIQALLLENIAVLRKRYADHSSGRSLMLQMLDLSDERMLGMVNARLREWLESLRQHQTEQWAALKADGESLLLYGSRSASVQNMLRRWKCEHIDQMDITSLLATRLKEVIQSDQPAWLDAVHRFVDDKIQEFSTSESIQRRYDAFVKRQIEKEIASHHDIITRLIQERLDEFSDEALVTFVEARIADDLQMIRINGSIVGSLVGMLLFVLVYCVERMYG